VAAVLGGPGIQIERIPGFLADGRHSDTPGANMEFPIVFEYAGPFQSDLQLFHDSFAVAGPRSVIVTVRDLGGSGVFVWHMDDVRLTHMVVTYGYSEPG
jgi:hypothetical protein